MLGFKSTPEILSFIYLKKCYFYLDGVYFLEYIISSKNISIKAKKIKVVKYYPKLKLICNI